ncbi:MAG: alpha-glucosidase/alpha-galactosidase [Treponema sp.]|jgi:alpha-galactosidase|nr:alpha-glucosidase/alpha-galactosidase [Treponema sp.]
MSKIVFIGAGSMVFTRNLVRDILSFPAFSGDLTIALVDTDRQNLSYSRAVVERIIAEGRYGASLIATTKREEVLEGADGVLITIAVGGEEATLVDIGIPEKYGVSVCVGDTRGPQGIFRYLRTIPAIMEIIRDVEKYCPRAIVLNYTNPMAMICRTIQQLSPVVTTGLCHSVQHTAEMLGSWIGAPREEISYLCAGINHQAHYLTFTWNGRDAYPLIRDKILNNRAVYDSEKVRNEMFLHLGYYVTESTVHNSEYNAWFRKRPDLIKRYLPEDSCRTTEKIRGWVAASAHKRKTEIEQWLAGPVDLKRGREYAAYIFNAVFGDGTIFEFNGNVRNFGLIDNLPAGSCVESPVEASRAGLRSIHVGPLPPQLAILNGINARIEDLAVEAYINRDREKVYYANYYDPLTSALLSLEEIRRMTDEMFAAGKDWLPL